MGHGRFSVSSKPSIRFIFRNNWSPGTTDIIDWLLDRNGNFSIDISQCVFRDHVCMNASIVTVGRNQMGEWHGPVNCDFTLLDCVFRDNSIVSHNGFVKIYTVLRNTYTYSGCSFINDEIPSSSPGIGSRCGFLSLGSTSDCKQYIRACIFHRCSVGLGSLENGLFVFQEMSL